MKRCQTCKHWNEGVCSSEKFIYVDREDIVIPDDALYYADSEGYEASFGTGPLFGCIHHEDKG